MRKNLRVTRAGHVLVSDIPGSWTQGVEKQDLLSVYQPSQLLRLPRVSGPAQSSLSSAVRDRGLSAGGSSKQTQGDYRRVSET